MRLTGRIFKRYQCFLKNGTYELNPSRTCFTLQETETTDGVRDFATEVTGRSRFRIRRKYYARIHGGKFQCTKMLLADGGNVAKCFDFSQGIVVSIFKTTERMHVWLQQRETFCADFPTSNILDCNDEECYVVEELLRDTTTSAEEKWLYVLQYYSGHVFDVVHEKSHPFPNVLQHGDLWSANVFCNHGECKFIDFDHAGSHMFFYDLALFMFTEAFIKKNKELLEGYLQGKYDTWIHKLCVMYGVEYETIGRKQLFAYAMREMISTRFNNRAGEKVTVSITEYLRDMGIEL